MAELAAPYGGGAAVAHAASAKAAAAKVRTLIMLVPLESLAATLAGILASGRLKAE